jgi:hypothetical protein
MRVLGTINSNAISMIDDGKNGDVDLVTLYPKDSIAIYTGTSYLGWKKAIPTGYVYISRCKFPKMTEYTAPAHTDSRPLIVIDRWWGVDYAKEDCKIPAFKPPGKSEATCEQERTESYNRFELELKTQFAAFAECVGIAVSSFGYPQSTNEAPRDVNRPYWIFSINYSYDKPDQLWQMLPPKGSHLPMMQATGTPSQIAKRVCTIIKGQGGAVSQ